MATHDNCLGINAQIRYLGKAGSPSVGETWQTGIRVGWFSDGTLPSLDAGRETMRLESVNDAAVARDTTNLNVEQGWAGTGGFNTPTDAEQDDIAEAFYAWAVAIKVRLGNQYVLGDIRLYPFLANGNSATAPSLYTPKTTNANPTGTSTLPLDVALAMSMVTTVRGPSGRGRMFIGGLEQSVLNAYGGVNPVAAGVFREATRDLLDTLRNSGIDQMGYTPVIHTRGTNTGSVINAVRNNQVFETQRRRDAQVPKTWWVSTMS